MSSQNCRSNAARYSGRSGEKYRKFRARVSIGCVVAIAVWSSAFAQDVPAGFVRSAKPRDVPRSDLIEIKQAKKMKGFSVDWLIVPVFVGDHVRLIRRDGELVLGMVDGKEILLREDRAEFVVPEPSLSRSPLRDVLERLFRAPSRRPSTEAMPQSAEGGFAPLLSARTVGFTGVLGAVGNRQVVTGDSDWAGKFPSDSFVVAGTRSFDISWTRGTAPYIVALDTPRARLKILGDTTERQYTSAPLTIHPGFVSLNVFDANGDLVHQSRFTSVPTPPDCPIAEWTNATPEERAVCFKWLATSDPRWNLESVQSQRPVRKDGKQ